MTTVQIVLKNPSKFPAATQGGRKLVNQEIRVGSQLRYKQELSVTTITIRIYIIKENSQREPLRLLKLFLMTIPINIEKLLAKCSC